MGKTGDGAKAGSARPPSEQFGDIETAGKRRELGERCFTADTLVCTGDGYRAVKEIQKGDDIYSRDGETGETGLRKVEEIFLTETDVIYHICFGEGREIETTAEHPFYIRDRGWVEASALCSGDEAETIGGAVRITGVEVEKCEEPVAVYNLQVEDWETFFVSELQVYVHNCGEDGERKQGGRYKDVKKKGDKDQEVHHMPADSASPLDRKDGPSVRMDKGDHRRTASCGSSRQAKEYRGKQKELIDNGDFRGAVQMDIDDIHEKFGDKYDEGISQMIDYVDELERGGRIT